MTRKIVFELYHIKKTKYNKRSQEILKDADLHNDFY